MVVVEENDLAVFLAELCHGEPSPTTTRCNTVREDNSVVEGTSYNIGVVAFRSGSLGSVTDRDFFYSCTRPWKPLVRVA